MFGILRTDLWSQGRRKPSLGANESGPSGMQDFCHMNLICKLSGLGSLESPVVGNAAQVNALFETR